MPALYPAPQHVQQPPFAQPTEKRRRRGLYAIIAAILAIIVLSSVVVGYLLYTRQITPTSPIVGHAFFVSSGQVDLNSSQGIADRLQVDVTLPAPQANKSYYFWLKSDNDARTDALPILLGTSSNGGAIHISYPGDAQHSDLLANYSRFLITEENAGTAPTNPSIDTNTWRYSAAFSQQPNPEDTVNHFSQLDHLRHLLAQDPKLKLVGLTGGLDIWLFRNTLKILEAAGSARDAYQGGDAALIQRQLIRILDYLDGSQYVQTEHLPPGLPPVLIDPTIARVALLEIDVQNQTPPGYLKHIGSHLAELTQVPGVTPAQKALAIQINNDINNVQGWLENVHRDAEKLIQMTPAQLQQPQALTILDDLFTQANNAFVGQTDPNTNQVREGVVQIHYNIQRLATFDLRPWQAS